MENDTRHIDMPADEVMMQHYNFDDIFKTFCRMMHDNVQVTEFHDVAEQFEVSINQFNASVSPRDMVSRMSKCEKMLLDGTPVGEVLAISGMSITDLVRLCAYSEAKIKIAEQGYALNILANDMNEDVRIAVIQQGYFDPMAIIHGSVAVKLEAIAHNAMLLQLMYDNDLRVSISALQRLLDLHMPDICRVLIRFYKFPEVTPPFIVCHGIGYTIDAMSCIDILNKSTCLL